jgi:hypothetical protein
MGEDPPEQFVRSVRLMIGRRVPGLAAGPRDRYRSGIRPARIDRTGAGELAPIPGTVGAMRHP